MYIYYNSKLNYLGGLGWEQKIDMRERKTSISMAIKSSFAKLKTMEIELMKMVC